MGGSGRGEAGDEHEASPVSPSIEDDPPLQLSVLELDGLIGIESKRKLLTGASTGGTRALARSEPMPCMAAALGDASVCDLGEGGLRGAPVACGAEAAGGRGLDDGATEDAEGEPLPV